MQTCQPQKDGDNSTEKMRRLSTGRAHPNAAKEQMWNQFSGQTLPLKEMDKSHHLRVCGFSQIHYLFFPSSFLIGSAQESCYGVCTDLLTWCLATSLNSYYFSPGLLILLGFSGWPSFHMQMSVFAILTPIYFPIALTGACSKMVNNSNPNKHPILDLDFETTLLFRFLIILLSN